MKCLISFIVLSFTFGSVFAQDYSLEQLENSPRHQEWVEIKDGDRTIHSFVVYPEVSHNTL